VNKNDLKKLIKPLVKECINEVLIEEGLLSNVVAEVAKGMQQSMIVESAPPTRQKDFDEDLRMRRQTTDTRKKLQEHRAKMMESVGKDAYNGVNLFEGTEAITNYEAAPKGSSQGAVDLGDQRDSGVDISSLVGQSSAIWQAIK
tara:strand:+ start:657 stop:1088 length:432 start_codon:yes stop_codon:yes gene_type:complete